MYNNNLHFHFTGIGGSGMSGIAEILLSSGFKVSGSDLNYNLACKRLDSLGVKIFKGHSADNLSSDVTMLVYSSAVKEDNPEYQEAKQRQIPIVSRAEVLAELMRLKFGVAVAGSHGKTTTTSLTALILEKALMDPTVVIGGIVKSLKTGGKLGSSEYLVAESDESDRSFLLLKPTIAVVTNIDAEHLNAYSSMRDLEDSFEKFLKAVPFYGLAIVCIDDVRLQSIAKNFKGRLVGYGFSEDADLSARIISQDKFNITYELIKNKKFISKITLPIPGRHLVLNSLAAIAVGLEFGIEIETIKDALNQFQGVARRLENCGLVKDVTIVSDYAHHPTEVKASLKALKEGFKDSETETHIIFQPHRYSRTKESFIDFMDSFSNSDNLYISKIYSAGEKEIEGITGKKLFSAIDHSKKEYVDDIFSDSFLNVLKSKVKPGDLIVCMGAGSIGKLPSVLLDFLSKD